MPGTTTERDRDRACTATAITDDYADAIHLLKELQAHDLRTQSAECRQVVKDEVDGQFAKKEFEIFPEKDFSSFANILGGHPLRGMNIPFHGR